MLERDIALKIKGWNTISDISDKLNVKTGTAYVYVHRLDKGGFVIQKIKKPRGTVYLIDPIPALSKNRGMLEDTDIVGYEMEFAKNKISYEHKIAYFLSQYKKEKNKRFYDSAKTIIRYIKNWKKLYRYLKAYSVSSEFKMLYQESRSSVKKIPRMPDRYKKMLGADHASR